MLMVELMEHAEVTIAEGMVKAQATCGSQI